MSNYHYSEGQCNNCDSKPKYENLNQTMDYKCGPKCVDRYNSERTPFDQMMYDVYVKGQQRPAMAPYNPNVGWKIHTFIENPIL